MNNKLIVFPNSPYREAWSWVAQHSSGSATSLAKLLLTLGNGGFSLAECLEDLDEPRLDLALRVLNHFAVYGRDAELFEIGRRLESHEPRLAAVIQSAAAAREALREQWRREDR